MSTPVRIKREDLLAALEDVQPGLSAREVLEQSSCFAIEDGFVTTYNDEVACTAPIKLGKSFKGAVQAASLLSILRKIPDDEIAVSNGEGELRIAGKGRESGVTMEAEIMLPLAQLERPKKWTPLHEDFAEALSMTQECAGKDLTMFASACVHLTPKWLEACDNYQMIRFRIPTGFKGKSLVKKESIKHVVASGATEFCETESWIHFRNPRGLIISCRRFVEEFMSLTEHLKVEGQPTNLPKGLAKELDCCEVFSSENADQNQVMVELLPGKLRVKGQGVTGWFRAKKNIKYSGPRLSFLIAPKLLKDITAKHNECFVSAERLKVDGGRWTYVACLGRPEDPPKKIKGGDDA